MYDKHINKKIDFQVVIDNAICLSFNTEKKRNIFIRKLSLSRKVTAVSNVQYPWNPEDGIHNLKTFEDFVKDVGISNIDKVKRAIKNGKIRTEMVDDIPLIVEKYGHYHINGGIYYSK